MIYKSRVTTGSLQERLTSLEAENEELRARLHQIEAREAKLGESRKKLMRGGFRLLIPLLDRQKVVRTFGELMETLGGFSGARSEWPAREQVLADTRMFMESVVRFLIRRRMFLLFFGLLGAAIPAVQLWLVVQQNEIIENQNKFFEIQVYDVVARSMTEGDRNARLMTGALLANADPEFLGNVVRESFDPSLSSVYRAEGVNARSRRLDDAAYRGHLIRAAVHSVENQRREHSVAEAYAQTRPMLQMIVGDASGRVVEVLRLGRDGDDIEGDRAEQVDHYLVQVGIAVSSYARMARANDDLDGFAKHLAPLLVRLSQRSAVEGNRFASVYRTMLQDLLFEMAAKPAPGDPPVHVDGRDPNLLLRQGLKELQGLVKNDSVDWQRLAAEAGIR